MHSIATGPTGSRADTTGEVAPLLRGCLLLLPIAIARVIAIALRHCSF